jgi:hypothetical protein
MTEERPAPLWSADILVGFSRETTRHTEADKNVRAPKNRDRGAGFSFSFFLPAPQSGCARPSLRLACSALTVSAH